MCLSLIRIAAVSLYENSGSQIYYDLDRNDPDGFDVTHRLTTSKPSSPPDMAISDFLDCLRFHSLNPC
jgi:hypothetical protein